ncbi:MAG: phosphoribosylformylglycinamidine synthase subunit PurQ [Clostridia bacterium]|nr:phosphoribosylformylglycinamidine synthase subunit PurQ [Clostridia bacterium]
MRFGVIVFPGSNCDADVYHVLEQVLGVEVVYVWHGETKLGGFDCLVLPGGFSYGDYLRTGAIARFSPVMQAVTAFAHAGGLVLGICNGFQILLEAGLLPGAMRVNKTLQFICQDVWVRVENAATPYTCLARPGQVLRLPIAHKEGNYYCDPATLAALAAGGQIVLRYCDASGNLSEEANPNGSLEHIAGICNPEGNVFGLMPHPERCAEEILGNRDGLLLWQSIVHWLKEKS